MKLSKKARYGLRALVDLSVNAKAGHVTLSSIAERNDISLQYLEQVFASLRKAKIVRSVKGPQGGYLLERDPQKLKIADIIEVLDGSFHLEAEEIPVESKVPEIPQTIQELVIDVINQELDQVLGNIILADLQEDYLRRAMQETDMFYI
ncbi:MAG: Rrf2 family transcriptional regulator [Lachnospiraceae bacterium]|nr:Rrf2 family transcriptional regulator [Lachnospiraceae bacterium]